MRDLVAFSLKQRVFYNLMFVVLIVVGFITLFALPAERYPNFGFGEVIISTVYPGASPVEVESLVTRKIEDALEQVDDVEWINSTSFSGRSNIRVKFIDDSDYDTLFNEVRFEVLNVISELPQGVDPPQLLNAKVQDWLPVIAVNLLGDQNNRALALMGEEIKTRILKVPEVQQVEFSGKQTQEFHIYLDAQKLRELGVSFDQVAKALIGANHTIPAGKYTNESGEFLVKMDERFNNLEQVQSTVVRRDADGSLVKVSDLASGIGMDYRDPIVIASVNGKPSLGLKIIKSEKGNAMKIRDQVVAIVEEFRPTLKAQGVELVLTQDSTVYIKDGLSTLGMNMLVGISLVSLIIWYFMGIRNAGLVTIGIPFAFMITMLIMYLTGNSLNEITLFSFVLVTGIVVDDAIVVTENIYRHVQEGNPLRDAIINGTSEVALPVISATMTTVAAFLPMLIMTGSTGQFFALVPKAVTFAIVASLIECLLILPIHYLDFGPRSQNAVKLLERDNAMMRVARRFTDWLLNLTMRYRLLSVFIVSVLFVVSVAIIGLSASGKVPLIRIQFFPDDYKIYYVDVVGPSNVSLDEIDSRVKQIAQTVMEDGPGMASAASGLAGMYFNEDYEPIYGNNHGSVIVTMPSTKQQSFDDPLAHLQRMRDKLKPIYEKEGYHLHVHPQNDGPPSGKDINVRVVGANVEAVSALSAELLKFMQASEEIGPNLIDLKDDRGVPKRVFRLQVDQQLVAEYGLDNSQVAQLAASVLDGRYLGKYRHIDEEVDIKLRLDPGALKEPENALYIPVIEDAGRPVYLNDLVQVKAYNESGEIKRYQGQRAISLKADIREGAPTSTPAVVEAVRRYYETIREGYPGATVTFGGEHEDTQRSFQSLAYAFIIAVLVMYVILATQFQSYLQPLIILSAVVFALIGVVFGKLITQSLFTVNSFIAVIGVAGVVVNDALVLIDFINKRYRSGMTRREAITEGVHIRLRPILLTTLTTSLGLLPMAVGFPSYSLVWGTMASTFVTGLAAATALTLFIIPVLWDLLMGLQERIARRRANRDLSSESY
ncbi:MAG: efflux RND transporter permease subunit [Candidatus Thiodiazotropha lotti]|uniref:Efflux RND transporter permease subunit n=1 Tax=Candidatus Thiodiazotropha lotti TaxID=2792787 RepID=A0A9E4K5Q4_9GAMM|nr:efflux RND transporter permease subunit [Candidatus Thiodiazotropha lotti]ODC01499.1 acriflavin resistance protein [Candidatus Thiodiazotropha endoloripes]MCG7920631.1 efflux RND transporter permease subunit [Candidatus Thiodiazotropha lotti]MCG7940047.1 efflux RND transporter permease subunit [Candidatus Thiodiazotropha lotti]MCG7988239.1 efflux RND transporter permease subunit [Candidatus Thiodiazotropha lotti]